MASEISTKGGCPPKIIDWKWVDEMLAAGCHGTEIAAGIGIHPETLYRRTESEKGMGFSEYSQEKTRVGDISLRKKQHEVALKGNTSMLIWMGKQRLGQKDHDVSKEMEEIKVKLQAYAHALGYDREQISKQSTDRNDSLA